LSCSVKPSFDPYQEGFKKKRETLINVFITPIKKKLYREEKLNEGFLIVNKENVRPIEALQGIFRRTLIYNDSLMLCHFMLEKNAEVPVHTHEEHQIGYIIKGKIKFLTESGEFIAKEGDCYVFDSNEKHGALILEDSEVIDVFNPSREDYK